MTIPDQGFTLVPDVLPTKILAALIESTITPEEGRGGVRNLLDIPTFRTLANSPQIRALVTPILAPTPSPSAAYSSTRPAPQTGRFPGIRM
jgi:hypothetical protein